MHIIRDITACTPAHKGVAIALGNFDGVHAGHRVILRRCVDIARAENITAAAMTFEPHPRKFFARAKGKTPEALRIYPLRRKLELMEEQGIDIVFIARFNAKLASMSAQDFANGILHRTLMAKHVVTGYNFAFGQGRAGNVEFLNGEAQKNGFGFTAVPPVTDEGGSLISSSAIRSALQTGNLDEASRMLGAPYSIEGHVRHGDKRGRTLGFPTANMMLTSLFKPRLGIYAARARWGLHAPRHAVVNIGIRPMFPTSEPIAEVYILDWEGDLYGKRLTIELIHFIRDEALFDSLPALRAQIEQDCAQARALLTRKGTA